MKNRFIDIFGFEPTSEESQFMQLKLDQVMAEAPSRSSISIKLNKKGGTFEGLADIFSGPGESLSAVAQGNSLTEMIHELSYKMRAQIKHWRSQRFSLDTGKSVL